MKTITRIASAAAICLAALLGTSCMDEMKDHVGDMPEFITGISVTSDDIDFSEFETPDTKVSYSSSLKFSFNIGDRLAIFPIGGEQTAFPLSQLEADGSAKFDGGAWALRSSFSYAAYYPENTDKYAMTDMNIPVSFKTQKQTGNNSTDGLGPDAFLFSKASKPDAKGNVTIEMKQCAGVVRLMATMPKGIDVDKVVLRDVTKALKVGGMVNLKTYSTSSDQYPTISNARTGEVTVDVAGLTTASGENNLIVYLWLPPQTLNGHQMEMDVVAADGDVYTLSTTCAKDLAVMGTVGLNFGSYAGEFVATGYSFRELLDGSYAAVGDELTVFLDHPMRLHVVVENNPGTFTPVIFDDVDYQFQKSTDESIAKVGKLRTGSTAWLGISAVAAGKTDFTVVVTSKATGDLLVRKSFTINVPGTDTSGGCVAVDMGLSVKWASWNVGASKPEDCGSYFAWGETAEKTVYNWLNPGDYKWGVCNDNDRPLYGMTKYTGNAEGGDGLTVLLPEDDAASVNWGSKWRMPTSDEFDELRDRDNCEWTWDNTKKGYIVKSLITGNSIFLPAAGLRYSSIINEIGEKGYYWKSSKPSSDPRYASFLIFESDGTKSDRATSRFFGRSVRAVQEN